MNNLLSLPTLAFHELTLLSNSVNRKPTSYRQSILAKAFYPLVGLVTGTFLILIHKSIDSILPENIADLSVVAGIVFFSNGKHLVGLALIFQKLLTWKSTKPFWKFLKRIFKTPPLVGVTIIAILWLWVYGLSLAPFNLKNQVILIIPIACNWGVVLFNFDNARKRVTKNYSENDEIVSKKENLSALALAFALTFACFGFLLKLNGILILLIITISLTLIIKTISEQNRDFSKPILGVVHEFTGIVFLFLAYCLL
jgi:hypothetical protein